MSDERFRRRIAEIAAADEGVLSDAARERILGRLMQEGPSLVRGAVWKRRALYAAGPVLAAAAAVVFISRADVTPRAAEPARGIAKSSAAKPGACASRPAPAAREFTAEATGASLNLGEVGLAVADRGASVRAERVDACNTIIGLASGRVTVHARDLGGGELSVRAPGGVVTVKGTIFSVDQRSDALVVEVAEGTVAVKGGSGEHLVHRGERLHLSDVGIAQGALDGAREKELRAALGVPAVVGFEALPAGEAQAPEAANVPSAPRAAVAARGRIAAAPEAAPLRDLPEPTTAPEVAPEAPPALEPAPEPQKPVAKAETAADWLTQAEQARKAGKFAEARTLYRRVAEQGAGATAEAAWVALARMELSLGHPAAARDATKRRQERFGHGTLEPEALWIDVRTYRQSGDVPRARSLAEELVRRWPKSPQARAAEQWLSSDE
jgi:hypothetical protein